jgi:ribosomal protein L2
VSSKVHRDSVNFYIQKKKSGRNNNGVITVRGRGGGVKRKMPKQLPLSVFQSLNNITDFNTNKTSLPIR